MLKSKKIIALLIGILLIISSMPFTAFATTTTENWSDYAAASFASGDGSASDPYQISSAKELAYLAQIVNNSTSTNNVSYGVYYKLTANIDLSAYEWTPIGEFIEGTSAAKDAFQGYFDGGNYTITGLNVSGEEGEYVGLFGYVLAKGNATDVIKNLTITNATITTKGTSDDWYGHAGILVGNITISGTSNVSVSNVNVSGTITRESNGAYVGGLAGYAGNISFDNCHTDVTLDGTSGWSGMGGFIGNGAKLTISNSTSSGSVSGSWAVGGFIGYAYMYVNISDCISYTDVSSSDWRGAGFIAVLESDSAASTLENCYAMGTHTYTNSSCPVAGFVGAVFGDYSSTFTNCGYDTDAYPNEAAEYSTNNNGLSITDTIEEYTNLEILSEIRININGGTHSSDSWTTITAATCTESGTKVQYCSDCGEIIATEVIEATGHYLYLRSGTAATCTEDGVEDYWECEACTKLFSDEDGTTEITEPVVIPATGHDLTYYEAKEATTEEEGNIEYWYCSTCDKYFADEDLATEITLDDTIIEMLTEDPVLESAKEHLLQIEDITITAEELEEIIAQGIALGYVDESEDNGSRLDYFFSSEYLENIDLPEGYGFYRSYYDVPEDYPYEDVQVEIWILEDTVSLYDDWGVCDHSITINVTGTITSTDDTDTSVDTDTTTTVTTESTASVEIALDEESVTSVFKAEELASGEDLKVVLSVNEAEEFTEVEQTAIDELVANLEETYEVALILDIDLTKYVGETATTLTELDEEITITIDIPEELQGKDLVIIRIHENEDGTITTDILYDIDDDDKTFTFTTDKFSTYAIAEVTETETDDEVVDGTIVDDEATNDDTTSDDTTDEEDDDSDVVQTGDTNIVPVMVVLMFTSLLGIVYISKKRLVK